MSDAEWPEDRWEGGPTVKFPTNWQARNVADYADHMYRKANTQASQSHWNQLAMRIRRSLGEDGSDPDDEQQKDTR